MTIVEAIAQTVGVSILMAGFILVFLVSVGVLVLVGVLDTIFWPLKAKE